MAHEAIKLLGAKDSRPELNKLMSDSKRRRFDVVLVWKFDRFAHLPLFGQHPQGLSYLVRDGKPLFSPCLYGILWYNPFDNMATRRKEEKEFKMKLGVTLGKEALTKLKEIELNYIRQGKKIRSSGVIEEAISKLWKDVCKK